MIFDRVKDVIQKEIQVEESKITPESSFSELGADSLDIFRIVIELEELFEIQIEETDNLVIVQDIVECVKQKIENQKGYKVI